MKEKNLKRYLNILLLLVVGAHLAHGQCSDQPIILRSQSQVDSFALHYRTCDTMWQDLVIGTPRYPIADSTAGTLSDITSLRGLEFLRYVLRLTISDNPLLSSLGGLDSLQGAGRLTIINNDSLLNFHGLGSFRELSSLFTVTDNNLLVNFQGIGPIKYIWEQFKVSNNASLVNFSGLDSLQLIQHNILVTNNPSLINFRGLDHVTEIYVNPSLIGNNAKLQDLQGLEKVKLMSALIISENPVLHDISQLNDSLDIAHLVIVQNPSLATCTEPIICNYDVRGAVSIVDNAPGCRNLAEVICVPRLVSGTIYYDENQNGIWDNEERPIPFAELQLDPGDSIFRANGEGYYYIPVDSAVNSTLKPYNPDDYWSITTMDSVHMVYLEESPVRITGIDFGLFPNYEHHIIHAGMYPWQMRCNDSIEFSFHVTNRSPLIQKGLLEVEIDSLVQFIGFADTMSAYDSIKHQLQYEFDSLHRFESVNFSAQLALPGVAHLNDLIQFRYRVYRDSVGDWTPVFADSLSRRLRCAYDPNDKLVLPDDGTAENRTDLGKPLIYTIRFQNTGNLEARDIVIRDTLSNLLDPTSLEVIDASHTVYTFQKANSISFDFPNIFLPDSTTDFAASQGYLTYSVSPNFDEILDTIEVNNRAYIYFDQNPPIKTNTTLNRYVPDLVSSTEEVNVSTNQFTIYPNPARSLLHLKYEGESSPASIQILNAYGQVSKRDVWTVRGHKNLHQKQLDISGLNHGIYWVQLQLKDGLSLLQTLIILP